MPKRILFDANRLEQLIKTNGITPENFIEAISEGSEIGHQVWPTAAAGWYGNLTIIWRGPSGGRCAAFPAVITGAKTAEEALRAVTEAARATTEALRPVKFTQPELF